MKAVVLEDWNRMFVSPSSLDRLGDRVEIEISEAHESKAEMIARLEGAQIAVVNRERSTFDAQVFDALPELELVIQTVGISPNVDREAATAHGVALSAAAGLSTNIDGVAELAIGLLLTLARRIPANDRAVRSGNWDVAATRQVNGSTMGILGLGKLGVRLAALGRALGMDVIAGGVTLIPERAEAAGVRYVSLDELASTSDALFIAARMGEATRGVLDRRRIESMKPTAYLINVARSAIVDEEALLEALRAGRIAGAGLDVFDPEPLPSNDPLLSLVNVVLTPHIGWGTAQNATRLVESTANAIELFLDHRLDLIANPEALSKRGLDLATWTDGAKN